MKTLPLLPLRGCQLFQLIVGFTLLWSIIMVASSWVLLVSVDLVTSSDVKNQRKFRVRFRNHSMGMSLMGLYKTFAAL